MGTKIFFGLLFSVCGVCYAEDAPLDQCSSNDTVSQDVYECSKQKSREADLELNYAYRALNDKVTKDYKAAPMLGEQLKGHIKKSQMAWIRLRDENCAVESFVISPETQAFETTRNYCIARGSRDRAQCLSNLSF
ncbi:lysozyme inhibitor LprI family protein [Pseudomonas brenneri]